MCMGERDQIEFWRDLGSKRWIVEYREFLLRFGMLIAVGIAVFFAAMVFVAFISALVPGENGLEGSTAAFRNIVLIIAGPVGFLFAFWRLKHSDEQVKLARKDDLRKEDERVETLFQGAVKMLCGSDQKLISLGLVQLQKTARAHPEDYLQTTISLICAAARDWNKKNRQEETNDLRNKWIDEMIKAAISLAHLFEEKFEIAPELDFRGLDFVFYELQNVTLRHEDVKGCYFINTIFRNCRFVGHFTSNAFEENNPDIEQPSDQNELSNEFLGGFFDQCDFSDANMFRKDFRTSDFANCTFAAESFSHCHFQEVSFFRSIMITRGVKAVFINCHFSPQNGLIPEGEVAAVPEVEYVFSNWPSDAIWGRSHYNDEPKSPYNNFLSEHFAKCSVDKGTLDYIGLEQVAVGSRCEAQEVVDDREYFKVIANDGGH